MDSPTDNHLGARLGFRTRVISLKVLIVGIIGTLLVTRVKPDAVWTTLSGLSLWGFVPVLVLSCFWFSIRVGKWGLLLRALNVPASLSTTILSFSRGTVVGLITPMHVGDLTRASLVGPGHRGTAALLVVGDRALDFVALVVLAGVGVGFRSKQLLAAMVGMIILIVVIVANHQTLCRWILKALHATRISEKHLVAATERCSNAEWDRGVLASLLVLSFLIYAAVIAQYHVVLSLISPGYDIRALAVCPAVMLARAVPFTFGGLGAREGVALALLPLYGIDESAAVAASLLMYPANLLIPLIGAIASLWFRSSGKNERAAHQRKPTQSGHG